MMMEQDLFALPKTQMSVDWKYTLLSNLQDIDNFAQKVFIQAQCTAIVGRLLTVYEPMALHSMVPNAAQTKLSLARRGIEPVTFALLARRSNQLS